MSDTGERLQDVVNRIGWEEAKETYPEFRRIMKDLGTNGVRGVLGQDTWINALEKQIDRTPGYVVIADGRFLDESVWVRQRSGVVVKVRRHMAVPQEEDTHRSEQEIPLIKEHLQVLNKSDLEGLRDHSKRVHQYVIDLEKTLEW